MKCTSELSQCTECTVIQYTTGTLISHGFSCEYIKFFQCHLPSPPTSFNSRKYQSANTLRFLRTEPACSTALPWATTRKYKDLGLRYLQNVQLHYNYQLFCRSCLRAQPRPATEQAAAQSLYIFPPLHRRLVGLYCWCFKKKHVRNPTSLQRDGVSRLFSHNTYTCFHDIAPHK